MNSKYTNIVYKSPKIMDKMENDFRSVIAADDIEFGELLLVEHCVGGTIDLLVDIVYANTNMFNSYYPRKVAWDDNSKDTNFKTASDKVMSNIFGRNDNYVLGEYVVRLNHRCTPNCCVCLDDNMDAITNTHTVILSIWSIRRANEGDELTIIYNDKTHNADNIFGFLCECKENQTLVGPKMSIAHTLIKSLTKKDPGFLQMIKEYLVSNECKDIMYNHYMLTNGIVFSDRFFPFLVYDMDQAGDYVNKVVCKRYPQLKSVLTKDINESLVMGNLSYKKTSLFMLVISSARQNI